MKPNYVCDEGTVIAIPELSSGRYGVDPDCPGLDDGGTVEIRVSAPYATPRTCPRYKLRIFAQPEFL